MNANARQVGGQHYAVPYQHWDFVADLGLGYFEGQITKYISRARKKNGLQDYQKALHFLEKLIEVAGQRAGAPRSAYSHFNGYIYLGDIRTTVTMQDAIGAFCTGSKLTEEETTVVDGVARWHTILQLQTARHNLIQLIADFEAPEPGAGYVNQGKDI